MTPIPTPLQAAAEAVIKRWDSPLWRQEVHTAEIINNLRAALAEPDPAPVQAEPVSAPTLRDRLQQQCSDWGTYWRASDSHGVELTKPQAIELLQDALGVEVEIKDNGCVAAPEAGKPVAWIVEWIQNNYQDHPNIASLCEALLSDFHSAADGAQERDAARYRWLRTNYAPPKPYGDGFDNMDLAIEQGGAEMDAAIDAALAGKGEAPPAAPVAEPSEARGARLTKALGEVFGWDTAAQPAAAPELDDDGERIRRCTVCGDPVRYGSKHSQCHSAAPEAGKPVALTYEQFDKAYRDVWSTFPSANRLWRFAEAIYALHPSAADGAQEDALLAAAYRDIAARNYDASYTSLFKAHVQEKVDELRAALASKVGARERDEALWEHIGAALAGKGAA